MCKALTYQFHKRYFLTTTWRGLYDAYFTTEETEAWREVTELV